MIPVFKPYFDNTELDEIKKVLDLGWVAGGGPATHKLEELVKERIGTEYAITINNCTSALHLALKCLGVKSGDEVLVADYTFPATGHAVVYCGATPVFVDVCPKTYNICPNSLEEKITDKTVGIVPVHTFGQPVEMGSIMEIAKRHGLFVVEDAACAFGAKYQDKYAGTLGDVGCFSFHARKGITTGEGGMCVTNNEDLAREIRFYSIFGFESAWDRTKNEDKGDFVIPTFTEIGYNYKMSDINAAVGIAQLRKYDEMLDIKKALVSYYNKRLEDIDFINIPYVDPSVTPVWQSYVVLLNPLIDRNELMQFMLNRGIQTRIGTYASHMQPVYKCNYICPISRDVFDRTLTLPLYCEMTSSDVDMIVDTLNKFNTLERGT